MLKYGDRNAVWSGEAKQTRGGLTKDDLIMSRTGKIVSKKKSESAKAFYAKNGGFKRKNPVVEPTADEPPKKKRKYNRRKKNESK